MQGLVHGSVQEILAMLASAIGAAVLTVFGFLSEQAGLHEILIGHTTLGVWEMAVGSIALFAGVYLLGYRETWRRFVDLRGGA